jgi:dihydrofolate reductase
MDQGRITLYIATSVDGYIADEDGGVGWLEEIQNTTTDEDLESYAAFFESVDCLVMGATTYEQVLGFGEWPYADRPTYVFTHRDLTPATDAVAFVEGSPTALSNELGSTDDHVWLVGGARLARAFLAEREVDELRLSLVPVLLGSGLPLFDGGYDRQPLRRLDTDVRPSGIVEHRYELLG